jgi:hypothetical protein
MRPIRRREHGVVLVFTAGILAILAALGTAFYAMTQSGTSSAVRYSDMVRADLLTRAGVADAIARLRQRAFLQTEDPTAPWAMVNYLSKLDSKISFRATDPLSPSKILPYSGVLGSSVGEDSDRYILQVEDAASKININACDNLAVVLDNLCRVIGPPLVHANDEALQPRRWAVEGADAALYSNTQNAADVLGQRDLCFRLGTDGRPLVGSAGSAVYGDGYAIAGFRGRNGTFGSIEEVKRALTYIERNGNGEPDDDLEKLEIETKYAALRPHITTRSWIDTSTVCVGKFEWVSSTTESLPVTNIYTNAVETVACQILIDRDKSWVADDPENDPLNQRGSLRGSYLSIMNGHGAGQLRRIATNGTDWVAIAYDHQLTVAPGPISSYMIIAREDAKLEQITDGLGNVRCLLPKTHMSDPPHPDGSLVDDPQIDYSVRPLCIHRAPVNINTASDKVLAALFMGLNIQHGHPMSLGADVNLATAKAAWNTNDVHKQENYLLTVAGLKRLPVSSGKIVNNRAMPTADANLSYLNNQGTYELGGLVNEAHELAYRIIEARQLDPANAALTYVDPATGNPTATNTGLARGPFINWNDFYFRIVQPWDLVRVKEGWTDTNGDGFINAGDELDVASRGRMIMANFNNNTDILKFNPNIEWIDRFGRNFTELEPIMVFEKDAAGNPTVPLWTTALKPVSADSGAEGDWGDSGAYIIRSLRYKSTDLIDKTDLNRSTTEFSFNSNGIYEIASTGQVINPVTGGLLAERRIEALVKVYDVWRESTQQEFINGVFSRAKGNLGTDGSGRVARGNVFNGSDNPANSIVANVDERLAIETLPEPLVPLGYRIDHNGRNVDKVDGTAVGHDAFGRAKNAVTPASTANVSVPDIVINRVLPACYDGQLVLATNTSAYVTGDVDNGYNTFLASFNGDSDTPTSRGNGREQAKTPKDRTMRTLDCIGLLGLLNDTEQDFDPNSGEFDVFAVVGTATEMQPLNPANYWENVMCRMGDLRADGVYLGNLGGSMKDASMKYMVHTSTSAKDFNNYDPRTGATVCFWFKSTWHGQDSREHEFFSATNKGSGYGARYHTMIKPGRFTAATWEESWKGGRCFRENSLCFASEDKSDHDLKYYIHGGTAQVSSTQALRESPAFRVQPFRWSFAGSVVNFNVDTLYDRNKPNRPREYGFRFTDASYLDHGPLLYHILRDIMRPFIDTARFPEGPGSVAEWGWNEDTPASENTTYDTSMRFYHGEVDGLSTTTTTTTNPDGTTTTTVSGTTVFGASDIANTNYQAVAWSWQQGALNEPCFSVNATNGSGKNADGSKTEWVYRTVPTDGTMAVMDELKLSRKKWDSSEIYAAMTTSRYYLPATPWNRADCPTFTSQSLLQSMKGYHVTTGSEQVKVARVTWTAFTPRFMHENRANLGGGTRKEVIKGAAIDVPYRGPFDYVIYNSDMILGRTPGEEKVALNSPTVAPNCYKLVDRVTPAVYKAAGAKQCHATLGIEVELLDGTSTIVGGKCWVDPDAVNDYPVDTPAVSTGNLRYRVRFRYPVDPLVDPGKGIAGTSADDNHKHVNPAEHYQLDTPVFDDVSITYFTKTRILEYREVTE